ncbi:MAG: hypothetical protein PHX14_10335, partial [Syntrophomonadaceae bacterium]|nr:hypothetical protein [Syntrophomonadaceae bacterium]
MNLINRIKDSMIQHKVFWMVIWPLVLLNIFTYVYLSQRLSIAMIIFFLFIALLGIGGIKYMGVHEAPGEVVQKELTGRAAEIMKEIRAIGEDIFSNEIERITNPVRENIRQDFARGLSWLWEDNQEFIGRVGQFLKDATPALGSIDPVNEDRAKL